MMLTWAVVMVTINIILAYEPSSISKCLWHNNSCVDNCPEHMMKRVSNCTESFWPAQKTCKDPEEILVGTMCGFSRCDCPEPMVLDTETGYCYDVDNCPTKHRLEK